MDCERQGNTGISPTISFIIPVYNTKEYLSNCINSILPLNDAGIEIIAIDDGSSDGSYGELLKIQETARELAVYKSQKNSGVSFTRNFGIGKARGKYIAFVDSDDIIDSFAYREMLEILIFEGADAIIGDIAAESGCWHPTDDITKRYKVHSSNHVYTPNHIAGGLYSADKIKRHSIKFHENMTVGEDQLFIFEFVSQKDVTTIAYDAPCYYFTRRAVSIMNGKRSEEKKKAFFLSHLEMLDTFVKYNESDIPDKEALSIKILQQKQTAAYVLMQVNDDSFVRDNLKVLKTRGYYPYKVPSWLSSKNSSMLKRMAEKSLQIELFAWIFHYLWKLSKR